jgi:Holliday junction resolvase RusA-like endonuclease
MVKINLKPLSVNECWRGRRQKTVKYLRYQTDMIFMLPNDFKLPEPPFEVHYQFGFSSTASDLDNPVKPFQDILSKRYKFDDKLISKIVITKEAVKKGKEYVKFQIITHKKKTNENG